MGLQPPELGNLCSYMLIAQDVCQKLQFIIGFEIFSKQTRILDIF